MVRALAERGLSDSVTQFKFDQARPDLSKFDSLLGVVLMEAFKALGGARTGSHEDAANRPD